MEMKLIDILFSVLMIVIGGILKHIYGKFENLDAIDKELTNHIHKINNNLSVLTSQKQTTDEDVKEIKGDIKLMNISINKILVAINSAKE